VQSRVVGMKWKLAFLTLGVDSRSHEKGSRWALKQQRIELKYEANVNHNMQSVDAFAGRSGPSRPDGLTLLDGGWTPCESNGAVSKKPGKKQTKFHTCVQKQGFGEDVLKCVNWKKGGGEERSADEKCKNACRAVVFEASKKNLVKAVAKCTDMDNLVNKLKQKKPETLATNGVLMFDDDEFASSGAKKTTKLTSSGKSKSPVNRGPGRPQSESKGSMTFGDLPDELLLFSDDMEDFGEPELMPERMIAPQFESPKSSPTKKGKKGKKGKRGRSG